MERSPNLLPGISPLSGNAAGAVYALVAIASFVHTEVGWSETAHVFLLGFITLLRVVVLIVLAALIWVPIGVWIGLRPRLARRAQPVVQFLAAFPANLFFPIAVSAIVAYHLDVEVWVSPWMSLGTQWYILFNVIAGAMAIPADLKEAARSYNISGWQRFWVLYIPAIFPYLVTGWVTAAGGAWNASIIAEYISIKGGVLEAHGLGARISESAGGCHFALGAACGLPASVEPVIDLATHSSLALLAASVLVMSTLVVVFNRLVWRRLYNLADTRFSVNR